MSFIYKVIFMNTFNKDKLQLESYLSSWLSFTKLF